MKVFQDHLIVIVHFLSVGFVQKGKKRVYLAVQKKITNKCFILFILASRQNDGIVPELHDIRLSEVNKGLLCLLQF